MRETREKLLKRILVLNERVWERKLSQSLIDEWLSNFTGRLADVEVERLHALFWLSQFMYFGSKEIRVLLKALYRDLYFCPMVQEVRMGLPGSHTDAELDAAVVEELKHTRFFGVGNPSESGIHLLYYFRQENLLAKDHFMDAVQVFTRSGSGGLELRKPELRRYVFLDDICGSGDTARTYSKAILEGILSLDPTAKISYYSLFASTEGIEVVRNETLFGKRSGAVYELDPTYRCLSPDSRYFATKEYPEISPELARAIITYYGDSLDPAYARGYKDSQLLLGFHHNTPDNTVGVVWQDHLVHDTLQVWNPIFKRYPKIYGGV
jgi:hypothetical protein